MAPEGVRSLVLANLGRNLREIRKELCRQVDELDQADQDVICHVMDSLIRKERIRQVVAS